MRPLALWCTFLAACAAPPAPAPRVGEPAPSPGCGDGAIEPCDCEAGKGYRACEDGSFGDCVCVRAGESLAPDLEVRPPRADDLARYIDDLDGAGPLIAAIETNRGAIRCELFADRTPITVANFVGLARGLKAWKDPESGRPITAPLYDGTTFHRVVKNFVIQGGDPLGTGKGGPGYTFDTEIVPDLRHDQFGRLAMARGPERDSNGSQFYIALRPLPHLDGMFTVFGQCRDHGVIRRIAGLAGTRGAPTSPVLIDTVHISRRPLP